jgi:hypothetical protein
MLYAKVVDELLKSIPELKPLYDENLDMWLDDYLPYVVFGSVVVPTMEELLKNDYESDVLKRIFDFIELMLQSEDQDVITLVAVEIAEWTAYEPNNVIRTKALKLMGTRTMEEVHIMENWSPGT